jgi:two-component system nitrate/nitrite response regulator NarL
LASVQSDKNKGNLNMDQDVGYKARPLALETSAPEQVTTYLICQKALLRTGVSYILKGTRFVLVGSEPAAGTLPELVLLCDSLSPDSAADRIKQLKEQYPGARLVALSENLDPWIVRDLCTLGLDGFCPTGMSQAAMVKALELVMLGEGFLPISVSLAMLEQSTAPRLPTSAAANNRPEVGAKFSDREAQILRFLTQGASNKVIARDLGLAEATVKVHVKAILRKAKAANRTQAAMWASRLLGPETTSQEVEIAN